MNREDFFTEIKDILLLDNIEVTEKTEIDIDSMSSLLLIAFFDENFNKIIPQEIIKEIKKVSDLMDIAGKENII